MVTSPLVLLFGKFTPAYSALCKIKLPKATKAFCWRTCLCLICFLLFTQLRKRCRTNTGCSSFDMWMIWTPISCRWCYIIASGILDGSLQITVKLCLLYRTSPIQLRAHHKALGFYDFTHHMDTWVKIASVSTCYVSLVCSEETESFPDWWQINRVAQLSVRANRDRQRRLFAPWGQAGGTPPCFVY